MNGLFIHTSPLIKPFTYKDKLNSAYDLVSRFAVGEHSEIFHCEESSLIYQCIKIEKRKARSYEEMKPFFENQFLTGKIEELIQKKMESSDFELTKNYSKLDRIVQEIY